MRKFYFFVLLSFITILRRYKIFQIPFLWLATKKSTQGFLTILCREHAFLSYTRAKKYCPAYKNFIHQNAFICTSTMDFSSIPETNKENYVKKYSIEDRCIHGKIPTVGVVIDESSGSSGTPNNWVRGPHDRKTVRDLLELSTSRLYNKQNLFVLNCFALGPWATGMNVSMFFADTAILKSIGPDKVKLENALRTFGPQYTYLLVGYPPFIKNFIDTTELNLKEYNLQLITGGEAMSLGLRHHLAPYFKTIVSSYGASDLDINMGVETSFAAQLRELCNENPGLCAALFGRDTVPMIFQYNPLDYYIETSKDGELIFTIGRLNSSTPKIRYNLRDSGGSISYQNLINIAEAAGFKNKLPKSNVYFPILYVYGRNDQSVPFYGAKISAVDMDNILHGTQELSTSFHSFQISVHENENADRFLHIALEFKDGKSHENTQISIIQGLSLHAFIFENLKKVNQDFREVTKMFKPESVVIEIHLYKNGPFSSQDIRIKQQYIR